MPLTNYREVPIKINNKKINVGGFKRPDGVDVFRELRNNHHVDAVISLSGDYKAELIAGGMDPKFYTNGPSVEVYDWYDTPFEKTKRIPTSVYDNVYEAVVNAQKAGKKIAIHCGAGDGRTGTALASLKLRELLETAYAENPKHFDLPQEKKEHMHMHYGVAGANGGEVTVTPFVKRAIEEVRKLSNHNNSVESRNDVESLMVYEQHLRSQLVLNNAPKKASEDAGAKAKDKIQSVNSSLSSEQIKKVEQQIKELHIDLSNLNGPYPYTKTVKNIQIDALSKLLEYAQSNSVNDSIKKVKVEYPRAIEGKMGQKIATFLDSLQTNSPALAVNVVHYDPKAPENFVAKAKKQLQNLNSNLSSEQSKNVEQKIAELQTDINKLTGAFPFTIALKKLQIEALSKLTEYSRTTSVKDAIEKVKTEYPRAIEGKLGQHIATLLDSLQENSPTYGHSGAKAG